MEGAMWKAILRDKSVPRAELDQQAREARLRFERMERQFLGACCRGTFAAQTAPLSLQRRHFGQCVARKPAKGAAEHSAAFGHADNS
jgi:hypothetical protein